MSAIDEAFRKAHVKSNNTGAAVSPRRTTRSVLETLVSEEQPEGSEEAASPHRIEPAAERDAGVPAPHLQFESSVEQGLVMMGGAFEASTFMVLPEASGVSPEQLGNEQLEKERREKERLEREQLESERLERERLEQEQLERERLERERLEQEQLERERLERERLEQEQLERERLERERLEQEQIERERLERERLEQEQIERERLERERLEQEQIERERLERERLEQEQIERERLERERLEQEQIERERLERERLEQEQIERERLERERLEQEQIERERLERERLAQEQIERERLERERLEQEQIERERLERERLAQEQFERERLERERLEQERLAQEQLELESQRLEAERMRQAAAVQQASVVVESTYDAILPPPPPTVLRLSEHASIATADTQCSDGDACAPTVEAEESIVGEKLPPLGPSEAPETREEEREEPVETSPSSATIAEAPAARVPFAPAWEVDEFAWPEMCEELYRTQSEYFLESGRQLKAATSEGLNVLAVTSHGRQEGRSTVALCLARCAAEAGVKVALFDADLEHPDLATTLQMAPTVGWDAAVLEGMPLSESAVASVRDELCLFPLNRKVAESPFELRNASVSQTWREAGRSFDLVILDMGPAGDDISQLFESGEDCPIDAAIVVRDLRSTDTFRLASIVEQLQKSGIDAVGVAENFAGDRAA